MFKKVKKFLAAGLSLSLILSSVTITALAESDAAVYNDGSDKAVMNVGSIETSDSMGAYSEASDYPEAVINVDGDVDVNVITNNDENAYGIVSYAHESGGGKATAGVTVSGDVSVNYTSQEGSGTVGINVQPEGNSNAYAVVNGDVSVDSNVSNDTEGIAVIANGSDAKAEVKVDGEVKVSSSGTPTGDTPVTSGVTVIQNGGDVDVNIKKDVTVVSNSSIGNVEETYSYANGIMIYQDSGDIQLPADTEINVGGNVSVSSTDPGMQTSGIDITTALDGSVINVNVAGSVTTEGKGATSGIGAVTGIKDEDEKGDTRVNIHVGKDVKSSDDGLTIMAGDIGTIDVVIEGTLSAEDSAIVLKAPYEGDLNQENRISITAWKIESGSGSLVTTDNDPESETTVSEETRAAVEKNINYIIRIDEAQTKNISLPGLEKDANGLYTAHAEDNVAVKLNIPSGFTLDGAYSDAGHNIRLLQDESGGYYLVVPSGGGVTVSLALSRIPSDSDDNDDSGDSKNSNKTYNNYQNVPSLSDDSFNFNQNEGKLTIQVPKGMTAFNLDSSVLLTFKAMGMNTLYLDSTNGKYTIPIVSIEDIVKTGNLLTFVFGIEKADVYVNGTLAREFYPDKLT
ncbi:hypothetical protein UYO_0855 [Lachnospiraceae bacterium JC7]|nr:hypothetical protein UYO_0855 [Lachnospiraceae bacterium JC7]